MTERLAVVDLGTNTFHLLIVETNPEKEQWKEIYRERKYIHLAEEGIETIGQGALERGWQTLASYAQACKKYQVTKARAFGTAALRTATNGREFLEQAKSIFPYSIEIIDGQVEANLIADGVSLAIPPSNRVQLIMDIGGGSVEFILSKSAQVIWAQSFPIGVAVLFKQYHHSDPINLFDQVALQNFLSSTLKPLTDQLSKIQVADLVGASGTFDVLENLIEKIAGGPHYSTLQLADFQLLFQQMMKSSLNERLQMSNLPAERAELIIVALLLIHFVIEQHPFENLLVSHYAMKEGMLQQLR